MRKRASQTKITPSQEVKGNNNRDQVELVAALVDQEADAPPRQVDRAKKKKKRKMRNGPLATRT